MAITITSELPGWTMPNGTTLVSPDGSIEIGDAQQTSFFPQFKKKKHDNAVNFSLRLSLPNYTPDSLTTEGNEVVFRKGIYEARFKYETNVPRVVNIGGTNYEYNGIENRFGFKIILAARPPRNYLDFTLQGSNIALDFVPALPGGAEHVYDVDGNILESRQLHVHNSISILDTSGRKNSRGGARIGHQYRSPVVDSAGNRTWADWSIINALTVRLTVPQAFLNTATYPVTVE